MKTKALLAGLVLASTVQSNASYEYSVSNEKCMIPAPILKSLGDSKKFNTEDALCNIDFYKDAVKDQDGKLKPEKVYSVCPKVNSTSPGILVVNRPAEMSDEVFRNRYCKDLDAAKKAVDAKVVAKFKQTITCSHATSGPAYYRVAEFLGGIRTPVSVFRKMDQHKHKEVAIASLPILKSKGYTDRSKLALVDGWMSFVEMHKGEYKGKTDQSQIFVENNLIYGALSENVTGEFGYTEVSGRGDYGTRYERFIKEKPYLKVIDSNSIVNIAGGNSFADLAPVVTQMKDVSNMIVIDHMLNQQDRIGNIHFKYKWYKYDQGEIKESKSDAQFQHPKGGVPKDIIPDNEKPREKAGEVLVKEMILKDNDCGISKSNNMKNIAKALGKIRHMDPQVYQQIQKLKAFVTSSNGAGTHYFTKELQIPEAFYFGTSKVQSIKANIIEVADTLRNNCKNQTLKLDLDLKKLMVNPNFMANAVKDDRFCDVGT